MSNCLHERFSAEVDVTKFSNGYGATVRLACEQCGEPFRFTGEVARSPNGLEIRLGMLPGKDGGVVNSGIFQIQSGG